MNAAALIEAAGWTLVHFLWQGALVGLLVAGVLRILETASVRYLAAVGGIVALLGMAAGTFWVCLAERSREVSRADGPVRPPMSEVDVAAESLPIDGGALANRTYTTHRPYTKTDANAANTNGTTTGANTASWQYWVVALWLCGVAFFVLRFLLDWRAMLRLRKSAETLPADSPWPGRFASLAEKMRVSRPVRLLGSAAVRVPVALGVMRPVVIMPLAMLSQLPPTQVEALLLHELAHVRRFDYLMNLFQILVEMLFFFHPAVWWISRRIREERENCCDDLASFVCGDVRAYAGALAALEESRKTSGTALSVAADGGGGNRKGNLVVRIRRLAGANHKSQSAGPLAISSVLALVAVLIVFLMNTEAAETEAEYVIRGRVINMERGDVAQSTEQYAPLAGVRVRAFTGQNQDQTMVSATSDSEGRWELKFRMQSPGAQSRGKRILIDVDHSGSSERDLMAAGEFYIGQVGEVFKRTDGTPAPILVPGKIVENVIFRMMPSNQVDGVLRKVDRSPIPGAKISVHADGESGPGRILESVTADQSGEFLLTKVPKNHRIFIIATNRGKSARTKSSGLMSLPPYSFDVTWAKNDLLSFGPRQTDEQARQSAAKQKQIQTWIDAVSQTKDEAIKRTALREMRTALSSGDDAQIEICLSAFTHHKVLRAWFDKSPFHDLVSPFLESENEKIRSLAPLALVLSGVREGDLAQILPLAEDQSPAVRRAAASSIARAAGPESGLTGRAGEAIFKLLGAEDSGVRRGAIKSLWGATLSSEIEKRLIELSRSEQRDEAYDAIYYGLSTQANKSGACVRRLIELLPSKNFSIAGRAAWGLGLGVAGSEHSLIVDAVLREMESRKYSKHLFNYYLSRLKFYADEKHDEAIAALIDSPEIELELKQRLEVQQWAKDATQFDNLGKHQKAIRAIREALTSPDLAKVKQGLKAFTQFREMTYRDPRNLLSFLDAPGEIQSRQRRIREISAPFHDLFPPLMKSDDETIRDYAANALVLSGIREGDLELLLEMVKDASPQIRKYISWEIVSGFDRDLTGRGGDAILELLREEESTFRRQVLLSLRDHYEDRTTDYSPELEARIIELTRSENSKTAHFAVEHALANQGNKSEASVNRLIELLSHPDKAKMARSALAGLAGGVDPKHHSSIADAALKTMAETWPDSELFQEAVNRLEQYAGPDQRAGIEALLARPGLGESLRKRLQKIII